MKTDLQLPGEGLRRRLAIFCLLIVLAFAAIEVLHTDPLLMQASPQHSPCWICHVGHSTKPEPLVLHAGLQVACVRLVVLPISRAVARFDGLRNSIRPPPSL